jgi:hypothetical protein
MVLTLFYVNAIRAAFSYKKLKPDEDRLWTYLRSLTKWEILGFIIYTLTFLILLLVSLSVAYASFSVSLYDPVRKSVFMLWALAFFCFSIACLFSLIRHITSFPEKYRPKKGRIMLLALLGMIFLGSPFLRLLQRC